MGITASEVRRSLEKNKINFTSLQIGDETELLLPARGGHILGPFNRTTEEALFWHPDDLPDRVAVGDWNIGGERLWFAPEVQFHVGDRSDFWGTYSIPRGVDPADHDLMVDRNESIRLTRRLRLECRNTAMGAIEAEVDRRISRAANPLISSPRLSRLSEGIDYMGYEHLISLRRRDRTDAFIEPWTLIQLPPGGKMIIPITPDFEYLDFYEPISDLYLQNNGRHALLRITGDQRYKIGIRSPFHFGRIGYIREERDQAIAVIRNFFNDPSAPYIEEPADRPGSRGLSISIYNDGGVFGGFGELECNGRAIGSVGNLERQGDSFLCWIYKGDRERVWSVVRSLLGYEETEGYRS